LLKCGVVFDCPISKPGREGNPVDDAKRPEELFHFVAGVFGLLKPSLISAGGAMGRLNSAAREAITIIPIHNAARHPNGAAAIITMVFLIFINFSAIAGG